MDNDARRSRLSVNPVMLVLVLSGIFFGIFVVSSAWLFMNRGTSSGQGPSVSSGLFGKGKVGLVEINGVILDSKKTLQKLETLEERQEVKAIVVRVNSPGGAVAPAQEIYEALKRIKKPVVVSMGSVAASGGYYISMGAKKVFANPGTITGSIGVIMEFVNLEKLYEWAKIKRYALKTGKYKGSGAEYRDMTPEERELLQEMIDNVLNQFKQAVVEGRKLSPQAVSAIADGRIFSGEQAKKAQLVDELGTLQDAVLEAAKLGEIKGKPQVVTTGKKRPKIIELLMDEGEGEDDYETEEQATYRVASFFESFFNGLISKNITRAPSLSPGLYWLWNPSM